MQREKASTSFTGTDHAWLSAALFVVLSFVAGGLLRVLESASSGSEPYHQSWLARAIDVSDSQLQGVGVWLVATGLAAWCLGLVLRTSWARLRRTMLYGGAVVVVLGLVAATDAACLSGYRASDGTCAWE